MGLDATEPEMFHMFVSREEWGAMPSRRLSRLNPPVAKVRYTHTATDECLSPDTCLQAVRNIQRNHYYRGFNDIMYNFLVGGDGRVYEGRGWYYEGEIPHHYKELNQQTIDFGFIGRFLGDRDITADMTDVAQGIVDWGIKHKMIKVPFDVEEYYNEL